MIRILALLLFLPAFTGAQTITTIAGNGTRGSGGNNGLAINAQLDRPVALSIDDSGNIYIVDAGNNNIRKVSVDGMISVFTQASKDNGYIIYKGAKIIITAVDQHKGISVDNYGNVDFTDGQKNMIRRISKNGMITNIAGTGEKGYSGDGGPATKARINIPWGVATDDSGNVFFADMNNNVVRKVNSKGIITTTAGTGVRGYEGDGGDATNAKLNEPRGIAADRYGNVYIADSRNDAVRVVNTNGTITTFAGNGRRLYHLDDDILSPVTYIHDDGHHGDGGPATKAQLYWPFDVALDTAGNLYIADAQNHVVRKVNVPPPPKKEKPASELFTVFADPGTGALVVKTDSGAYTSFTITDIKGKVVMQQLIKEAQTNVDISTLPPAHYYINIKKDNKTKSAMFVKDK